MELRITLTPEVEQAARKRAAQLGLDVETYVIGAIQDNLTASSRLNELLAPLRAEFNASGMSEQQLDDLVEQARNDAWQDRQSRRAKAS